MTISDLTLRRITFANPFQLRFHLHPNPLFLNTQIITSICPKIMTDDIQPINAVATKLSDIHKSKDEEGLEKTTPPKKPIPPPPEKPLPGDCCGSGCVRCVWDVYYEELEEYNRLYKAN
ncbi:hypothetical protein PHJA_000579800 [Phtheirospermum japonicum]|uniref:Oxidoreductase-like domain-containing protein n=1 Tax=Phtheirospermum japonicum TaxID=374723 RepID=A0A830B9J6_9LAMI|nr:hypothetical protein PHJA_000579800 [Phtheirospermum japonicum]